MEQKSILYIIRDILQDASPTEIPGTTGPLKLYSFIPSGLRISLTQPSHFFSSFTACSHLLSVASNHERLETSLNRANEEEIILGNEVLSTMTYLRLGLITS
jgi:hypothetical protein